MFTWFGRGEKSRSHEPLLRNIWLMRTVESAEDFWSPLLIQRARILKSDGDPILLEMPCTKEIMDQTELLIKRFSKNRNKGLVRDVSDYKLFFKKACYNKSLLVYSQRKFLVKSFANFSYSLEDTNRPFDWDHISPRILIRNERLKKGIAKPLAEWYESNGNYRAWPFGLNRRDQDTLPKNKLKDSEDRNNSCCQQDWLSHDHNNLENNIDHQRQVYNLIMRRNFGLLKEWYQALDIESLLSEKSPKPVDAEFIKIFDASAAKTRRHGESGFELLIGDLNGLGLYIRFPSLKPYECITTDQVEFGVYGPYIPEFDHLRRLLASKSTVDDDEKSFYAGKTATLVAHSPIYYIKIVEEFLAWLFDFNDEQLSELAKILGESLNAIHIDK